MIKTLWLAAALLGSPALAADAQQQPADPLSPTGRWTARQGGAAQTPPMGWNSWNAFRTEVNEDKVLGAAQALVDSGLARLGYVYVNIDDGWWLKRREADGRLEIRTAIFPSALLADGGTSFRPLVNRLHGMGLKAGIYTDVGRNACSQAWDPHSPNLPEGSVKEREVGLEGHVGPDLRLFLGEWGFDYVKVDACGLADFGPGARATSAATYAPREPLIVRRQPAADQAAPIRALYEEVARTLKRERPGAVLSICTWGRGDVRSWGHQVGQLWRTSPDITPRWDAMLRSYDSVATRALYARPGAWNDPDMLFIGAGDFDAGHLTEARSHFSLWALMASPLLISYDLRRAPRELLDIWGNQALVAVNQDPLGHQGVLVQRSAEVHVIVKTLSGGRKAVALFNRSGQPQRAVLTSAQLKLDGARPVSLRDLWSGKHEKPLVGSRTFDLKPHETRVFEARGEPALKSGVYLSEMPARIHVAEEGVAFPHLGDGSRQRWPEPAEVARIGGAQADASALGGPLRVAGRAMAAGLGVFANSRLEVRADGEFQRLVVRVGVDDASQSRQSAVRFKAYGDGRLLAETMPLGYGQPPQVLEADVAGVRVIELVSVSDASAPTAVAWGEAHLLRQAAR